MSETPRLVAFLARNACGSFITTSGLLLLLALLGLHAYWPIRVEEDFSKYLSSDGPQHFRIQAYEAVRRGVLPSLPQSVKQRQQSRRLKGVPERSAARYYLRLIYLTPDGSNIFAPGPLNDIRNIEMGIMQQPHFRDFCLRAGGTENGCERPISVVNFFWATVTDTDIKTDGQGGHLLPIDQILWFIGQHNLYFLDRFFGNNGQALYSNVTRTVMKFGIPLRGYSSITDRPDEQEEKFRAFVANELYPFLHNASTPRIKAYFYGDVVTNYEIGRAVWHDSLWAMGSLGFVLLFLIAHLRSAFLASVSLFCIAISFPFTYVVYCYLIGPDRMIAINFLSLFVVLGVGADDVFVLTDIWRQNKANEFGDRLWKLYCKAGVAIFATSATTAASFFSNVVSSIGPLRDFGLFMGLCISANWLCVVIVYPLALVVHQKHLAGSDNCSTLGRFLKTDSHQEEEMQEHLMVQQLGGELGGVAGVEEETQHATFWGENSWANNEVVRRMSRLGPRKPGAFHRITCLVGLLVPILALLGSFVELQPARGVPQFFPEHTNLGDLQNLQRRFGNESTVAYPDLMNCNGVVRPKEECQSPSTLVISKAPSPAPPSPATNPRPVTHASQPPTPPLSPAPKRGHEMSVRVQVKGHSVEELQSTKFIIQAALVQKLGLNPDDVSVDIAESQADETLDGRRLEQADSQKADVIVHFHNLSDEQRRLVRDYMNKHQDELQNMGAFLGPGSPSPRPSSAVWHTPKPAPQLPRPTPSPTPRPPPPSPPSPSTPSSPSPWAPWPTPQTTPSPLPSPVPAAHPTPAPLPTPASPSASPSPPSSSAPIPTPQPPAPLLPKTSEPPLVTKPPSPQMPATKPSLVLATTTATPTTTSTSHDSLVDQWMPSLLKPFTHSKGSPSDPPPKPSPPKSPNAKVLPTFGPKSTTLKPSPKVLPTSNPVPHLSLSTTATMPPLHIDQKKRGMAFDRTASIDVVFGLKPGTGSDGLPRANIHFNLDQVATQRALLGFCDAAGKEEGLNVFKQKCWIRDFKDFLQKKLRVFPSVRLREDMQAFLEENRHLEGRFIGVHPHTKRVLWVSVSFRAEVDTHSSARSVTPIMDRWDRFVSAQSKNATRAKARVGRAFACSDIFVRAEAEVRILSTTLSTWLVSLGCALFAVVAFTRDCLLSASAAFAIFATSSCSLFFITSVFRWHFGLMEAVSLIVFCGFSVDYPLHVVQAYNAAKGGGAREALSEIGCAVFSGCATTVGAAVFLLLCEIKVFQRFGQVLVVNMSFALIYALLWLPALLEWRERRRARNAVARVPPLDLSATNGFVAMSTPRGQRPSE